MMVTTVERDGRVLEQRRQARHHEDAGGHHGRGVDQGRDRRRAFHRVRQPGVQEELRRLAHGADEQQQAGERQRVPVVAEEVECVLPASSAARGKIAAKRDRAEQHEDQEDAEREAEVADAVDDEGLDGGGVGGGLLVPEADQQIGGEAHAFPAEEQLHEVVGRHQRQHGEGEQRQIGEEARPVRILGHVADGVEVHERRDRGDHDQHHRRQRVDAEGPVDLKVARRRSRARPGRGSCREPKPTWKKATQDRTAETKSSEVVTISEPRAPIRRPNRPAIREPSSGRKTIA